MKKMKKYLEKSMPLISRILFICVFLLIVFAIIICTIEGNDISGWIAAFMLAIGWFMQSETLDKIRKDTEYIAKEYREFFGIKSNRR